jgi:hypothetical protein
MHTCWQENGNKKSPLSRRKYFQQWGTAVGSIGIVRMVVMNAMIVMIASGCAWKRPSELPNEPQAMIVIKSVKLPPDMPWITRFAEHSYFEMRRGPRARWERLEVLNPKSGRVHRMITDNQAFANQRWGNDVKVIAVITGPDTEQVIERMLAASRQWPYDRGYQAWPGPNSNTFVAMVMRNTPGLSGVLDHNAVGKDFPGQVALHATPSRTGFQFDTFLFGASLGWKEGIEVHLLQLTFGVSWWPPAVKIPFLPRIGWN